MRRKKEFHGETTTRLYIIWKSMVGRCYCPKQSAYYRYGARGIRVCERWRRSYLAFRSWAISSGYRDRLQIDRRDGEKGYYPGNCRWATGSQNTANQTRKRGSSRYKGVYRIAGLRKKWRAAGHSKEKWVHLGHFEHEEDAARAYDDWARRVFGEFANLNSKEHSIAK